MLGASNTILEVESTIHQILRSNWKARLDQGLLESFNPHLSDVLGRRRSDETNPSMPQFKQVLSGDSGNLRLVHAEGNDSLSWLRRAEASDWQMMGCEFR